MTRLTAAGLMSLIAAMQPAGDQRCACPSPRQFPAGIVDTVAHAAYVANAGNGVTAVALDSGATLWTSASATLPVGMAPTAVVALRRAADPREAQIVLLNRLTGAVALTSQPFRPGRDPIADRMLGSTLFSVDDKAGTVLVRWRDLAPAPGGTERDIGRTLSAGGVQVSGDGAVRELPREEEARDLSVAAGPAYQRGTDFISGSWGQGACARTLLSEQRGDRLALVLQCGSAGAYGAERRELVEAPAIGATVSIDGCSIFVETASRDGHAVWTVFSSADGERLGVIPREPGAWNPATAAGSVFYLVDWPGAGPRTRTLLRAVDLKTGSTRWELPVRGRTGKPGLF